MVGVKRLIAVGGLAAVLVGLAGCPSQFLARIKEEIAKFPFTATSFTFEKQWGNDYPEYSFGPAVVKVDTAGFVYVADSTFRIRKFNSSGVLQKTYDVASTSGISGTVYDMAFDPSGNMYVATDGTNRIQKYDVSGNLLLQWGTSSVISVPAGLAVDSSGNVFVLDSSNNKVFKYDSSGNPGTPASWDGTGAGGGGTAFSSPSGIAVDANGYLYVADTYNNTIKKYYASTGGWIGAWSIIFLNPRGITVDTSYSPTFYVADTGNNLIVKTTNGSTFTSWGTPGTGNGQFNSVKSVAVDSSGNVYTADIPYPNSITNGVGRIQRFDGSGTFIASWGGIALTGNSQFTAPAGVAFDPAGNVYVSDAGNSRIQKFDSTGAYVSQWGNSSIYGPYYGSIAVDSAGNVYAPDINNHYIQVLDSSLVHLKNIGGGTLNSPTSVALDASGNIYVADVGLGKVVVFDPNGYTTHVPATIGTSGTADGQLGFPVGVAVDSAGNVYVTDFPVFQPRTNMVQKFDSQGNFVMGWGTAGTGDGQFTIPWGIAVDKYDNVYICDFVSRRVQKFDSNGNFLAKWGGVGVGEGTFGWPFDVAVNSSGHVLVSDVTNNLVQLFAPAP
jgi:tripartite motif-containing protein 71